MSQQKTPKKKGLKQFSHSIQVLFKKKEFKYFSYILAAFIILGSAALYYIETQGIFKYPQVSQAQYQEYDEAIRHAIQTSKQDTTEAITILENLPTLPKLLENRRNYILAKLYQIINEPVLAFLHAYDIEQDYLTKFSLSMRSKIAEQIGLEGIVVKDLGFLAKKFPQDPRFLYELSKSYSRQNRVVEARKSFKKIQTLFPDSDYSLGSEYYLANLSKENEKKFPRLRTYLTKSPNGNLAYLISDQIQSLEPMERKEFDDLSNYMALSYYNREDYDKAIKLFNKELDNPDLYLEAYANTLAKLHRKQEARALLLEKLPEIKDLDKASRLVELICDLSDKSQAIANLQALENKLAKIKDKILWELAKRTKTKESYQLVYKNYPKSFYAAESMSQVFWKEYERKNYHGAIEIFKVHWKTYPSTNSHPFVAFWAAKAYDKLNQHDDAVTALHNLIIEHPRDYYGYRAEQIINGDKDWFKLPSSNHFNSLPDWDWPEVYKDAKVAELYGADVLELSKIGEYSFLLENENQEALNFDKNFKMWLYAQADDYLKAISTAYFSLDKSAPVNYNEIKFIYAFPMPYSDIITDEISKNRKIDPMLAHSLIKQESRYQKDIVSKVGAIGLMQLMPYTARALARDMGMQAPQVSDLMQPEINIKLGVRYMEDVFQTFDNNMIHAIASYNAGPVAIKGWKKRFDKLDPDEFIENIPYDETKTYVKHVLNNYWVYKQLYH